MKVQSYLDDDDDDEELRMKRNVCHQCIEMYLHNYCQIITWQERSILNNLSKQKTMTMETKMTIDHSETTDHLIVIIPGWWWWWYKIEERKGMLVIDLLTGIYTIIVRLKIIAMLFLIWANTCLLLLLFMSNIKLNLTQLMMMMMTMKN